MKQFDFANFSPLTIVCSLFSVLGWRNKVVQFFTENAIFVLIQSLNLNINVSKMKIEVVERDVTGMGHRKYDGKGDGNVT